MYNRNINNCSLNEIRDYLKLFSKYNTLRKLLNNKVENFYWQNEKKNIKLNVIIQAGGKGTRLKHNTWNRPKCLVPVLGKTLLYHTLDAVDANSFYLIGDYKFDALKLYTDTIKPKNKLHLIKAKGSGSLSGINQALHLIKNDEPILIIWSDLFFTSKLKLQKSNKPLVGISDNFPCRYLIQNKKIKKKY